MAVLLMRHWKLAILGALSFQVAGEAIDMTGTIERRGGWLVLRSDPRTWQPVGR